MDEFTRKDAVVSYFEVCFNTQGEECDQSKVHVAKTITKKRNTFETLAYYIHTDKGDLYNHIGENSLMRGYSDMTFKKVSESCFNYYLKYLKTNKNNYLIQAERER